MRSRRVKRPTYKSIHGCFISSCFISIFAILIQILDLCFCTFLLFHIFLFHPHIPVPFQPSYSVPTLVDRTVTPATAAVILRSKACGTIVAVSVYVRRIWVAIVFQSSLVTSPVSGSTVPCFSTGGCRILCLSSGSVYSRTVVSSTWTTSPWPGNVPQPMVWCKVFSIFLVITAWSELGFFIMFLSRGGHRPPGTRREMTNPVEQKKWGDLVLKQDGWVPDAMKRFWLSV